MTRTTLIGLALATLAASVAGVQVCDAASADAVPPNYRQLIIQRILKTTDARTIRGARISQAHEQWAGLFGGGNRPTVCVEVIRETVLTSNARDVWAFTFQDGQIATAGYSYANCGTYSPFDELLKQR
jgi:hypothetical protein